MFRISLLIAALLVWAAPVLAQEEAIWLRYPAISPDGSTLVFTYRGDLYRVPSTGGVARQLTTHPAHDFMPVWSRDGRTIAFASDRHGNFDVYVMPAEGGEARRLTVHSVDEYPYAFTADGEGVIYGAARLDAAENRLFPTAAQPELYQVSVEGGRPTQLLTTPAEAVDVSPDGRFLVYEDRKGGENAWRKHHRSSVARDLWIHDIVEGSHRKLTTFEGEDRNPVFADGGQTVYYLSEASGTLNVHRIAATGGESEQLTRFEEGGPVRFLTRADNGTLAFAHAGHLYTRDRSPAPSRGASPSRSWATPRATASGSSPSAAGSARRSSRRTGRRSPSSIAATSSSPASRAGRRSRSRARRRSRPASSSHPTARR